MDVLPRVHGSAIFQRGETQALITVTLGTNRDAEPARRHPEPEFPVVLRTWPEGERRVLGHSVPHGVPTTWE